MFDGTMLFSEQQALTGTSDVISTNVYDAGSAKKVFGGANRRARLTIHVTASGGTTPTFRARFVGADNAALSTNPIVLADTGTTAALVATDIPKVFELLPAAQTTPKRYYGVIYTQGGTTPTATVNAYLATEPQSAGLR